MEEAAPPSVTLPPPKEKPNNYFIRELKMLKVCGVSVVEDESIAYKIYACFYMLLYLGYPFAAFSDLFKYDFDVVADLLIYELASFMSNTEFVVTMLNITKIRNLLKKLEEEPFSPNPERGGDVEEKLIRGCVRFTRAQAMICWISVLVTVGMATVFTLIKRIRSSDYHDWEFTYGPLTVLNVTYSPNYEITWLYQIISTSTIGVNHCTTNLIMAGILAHASVQFQILQNNLRRIVDNAFNLMIKDTQGNGSSATGVVSPSGEIDASTIPWKYLKKSLDETVRYHMKILEITTEMGEIFSVLMLSVFLFSLGVLCFLVYHASVLELNDIRLVKTFTDSITALFPVMLLCYWSQEVVFESQKVGTVVFEANFVGADLRFQEGLNMITMRSQRAMQLKAGKFIEINLATFVWIMRTSYSSFMVLRTVNTK